MKPRSISQIVVFLIFAAFVSACGTSGSSSSDNGAVASLQQSAGTQLQYHNGYSTFLKIVCQSANISETIAPNAYGHVYSIPAGNYSYSYTGAASGTDSVSVKSGVKNVIQLKPAFSSVLETPINSDQVYSANAYQADHAAPPAADGNITLSFHDVDSGTIDPDSVKAWLICNNDKDESRVNPVSGVIKDGKLVFSLGQRCESADDNRAIGVEVAVNADTRNTIVIGPVRENETLIDLPVQLVR